MGVIQAGILSRVSGKVAGVVGGNWKGIAYLRAYVTPSNPNTEAQQVQRGKMAQAVAFIQPIVGSILNVFVDPFTKNISGFNKFISSNIAKFGDPMSYEDLSITEGKLFPAAAISATYATATGIVSLTHQTAVGSNGAAGDIIIMAAWQNTTGRWFISSLEDTRAVAVAPFMTVAGMTAANIYVYCFAAHYVDEKLTMVSNSNMVVCSAV
jgi:hypothetical protein